MEGNFCSPEITELAKAMLKVQAEVQPALKDRENPFTHSHYATLNSVMDACRDALLAHNIWCSQYPVPVEPGHIGLVTKLTHADSGQWQASLLVMPLPKADPQGYGSALTYARRYALSALIGLVTEDDDGEGTKMPQPVKKSKTPAPATPPARDETPGLPKIDGITYQTITAADGRRYVVATRHPQKAIGAPHEGLP